MQRFIPPHSTTSTAITLATATRVCLFPRGVEVQTSVASTPTARNKWPHPRVKDRPSLTIEPNYTVNPATDLSHRKTNAPGHGPSQPLPAENHDLFPSPPKAMPSTRLRTMENAGYFTFHHGALAPLSRHPKTPNSRRQLLRQEGASNEGMDCKCCV